MGAAGKSYTEAPSIFLIFQGDIFAETSVIQSKSTSEDLSRH